VGVLGPVLNKTSGLSIRNGVLVYKQLIRPMMDYACPVCRSVSRTHVRKLQALQSKRLGIVTGAPWYCTLATGNLRGFASSILHRPHQNPNGEFRLKVSWCGETLSSEFGR